MSVDLTKEDTGCNSVEDFTSAYTVRCIFTLTVFCHSIVDLPCPAFAARL